MIPFADITSIDDLIKVADSIDNATDEGITLEDLDLNNKITPSIRKTLNKAITPFNTSSATSNKHFDDIPLAEIMEALKNYGYTLLQEDNTPWEGMLTGTEGNTWIAIGVKRRRTIGDNQIKEYYDPVKNSGLALSWYKMPSGNYEITAYIS